MDTAAAVVIGGGPVRAPVRDYEIVVAADSGLDEALAAGFTPTVLVGDLDSISESGTRWVAEHEIPVQVHPTDKDATDTALALETAVRLGAVSVDVYGATGVARLDHLLGTVAALGDPVLHELATVRALLDESEVYVLHPGHSVALDLAEGATFSLLALHGRCDGVDVTGARWPLERARLTSSSTLGISNTATGPVRVSVDGGVLTVVVPASTPR
ncbi:MAG: thiamine diphosphokinase [Acidimicrobiales bacterium]